MAVTVMSRLELHSIIDDAVESVNPKGVIANALRMAPNNLLEKVQQMLTDLPRQSPGEVRDAVEMAVRLQLRENRAKALDINPDYLRVNANPQRLPEGLVAKLWAFREEVDRHLHPLVERGSLMGSPFSYHPVWGLTPVDELKLIRQYGPRRAAMVVAACAWALQRMPETQIRTWRYRRGFHLGEAMRAIMPPPGVVRKGPRAIDRWLRVARYLGDAVERVPIGDVLRLSHLSPFWIQVAFWGASSEETFSRSTGRLRRSINWEHLSQLMKRQASPVWQPATHRGVVRAYLWYETYGRVPQDKLVFMLPADLVTMLKPNWRHFMALIRLMDSQDDPDGEHQVLAAAKLAICFGGNVKQLVSEAAANYPGRISHLIHDLGINLSPPYSKEVTSMIWRQRRHRYSAAVMVANSWAAVTACGGHAGLPFSELLAMASSLQYVGVVNPALATEAARWGVDQEDFERLQADWLRGLRELTHESVPWVSVVSGDYRFYRLAKDDPRGIFLGLYTDCCQHPAGAGRTCAWHGHGAPDGGFYVVEYRGQVIAQSWAWRSGPVLVLDNIEVLGRDAGRCQAVKEIYTQAAEELLGRLGVTEVRVGTGMSDVDLSDLPEALPVAPPAWTYSDARRQVVLARKEVK